MKRSFIIVLFLQLQMLFFIFMSSDSFAVVAITETGRPLNNCGGGNYSSGPCPYEPVGNCDATTGNAKAIPMSFNLPVNTGRHIAFAATSPDLTFNVHDGNADPIPWSSRYKKGTVGKAGNRNKVGDVAIKEWVLETLPANGTIYDGATAITTADYSFTNPDSLWYKPNASYIGTDTLSYCAYDSDGRSNISTINLTIEDLATYSMPYAFSNPGYGIDEQAPADPPSWPSAESPNFYYIDSDHANCADTNVFGSPDSPRCSIPGSGLVMTAGGKIVIADSTIPYELRVGAAWHQWTLNGNATDKVWVVGNVTDSVKPIIKNRTGNQNGTLRMFGSYYVFEGIDFQNVDIDFRDQADSNVVFRHSKFRELDKVAGAIMGLELNETLIFNSTCRNNGNISTVLSDEQDIHCFNVIGGNNIRILDLLSHNNAGDTVQLGNGGTSSNVYMGRMVSHSDMENCVDIKDFNSVIVTQSDCYDIRRVSYSSGSGGFAQSFYINDEGVQQNYVYFLLNRAWDTGGTAFGASNVGGRAYFLGNVVLWSPQGSGFTGGGGSGQRYFSLNTVANVANGINNFTAGLSGDRNYTGNLIHAASVSDYRTTGSVGLVDSLDYNATTASPGKYLYNTNSNPILAASLADYTAQTGFCANCAEGVTANFTNPSLYDFSITGGTILDFVPASAFGTGSGLDDSIDALQSDLGLNLIDLLGSTRSAPFDLGAYKN